VSKVVILYCLPSGEMDFIKLNIGTFACYTFPRDTKACKRAKIGHQRKLLVGKKDLKTNYNFRGTNLFKLKFKSDDTFIEFAEKMVLATAHNDSIKIDSSVVDRPNDY
jgi:hypothetical protein